MYLYSSVKTAAHFTHTGYTQSQLKTQEATCLKPPQLIRHTRK